MEDWSGLSEDELRAKLAARKVLNGEHECSECLRNLCKKASEQKNQST
jgi:hypothetical protein